MSSHETKMIFKKKFDFFNLNKINGKITLALFSFALFYIITSILFWFSYDNIQNLTNQEEKAMVFSIKIRIEIETTVRGLVMDSFRLLTSESIPELTEVAENINLKSQKLKDSINQLSDLNLSSPNLLSSSQNATDNFVKIAALIRDRILLSEKKSKLNERLSQDQKKFTVSVTRLMNEATHENAKKMRSLFQNVNQEIFNLGKDKDENNKNYEEKRLKIMTDVSNLFDLTSDANSGSVVPIGISMSLGNYAYGILMAAGNANDPFSLKKIKTLFIKNMIDAEQHAAEINSPTFRQHMNTYLQPIQQAKNEENSLFNLREQELALTDKANRLFYENNQILNTFFVELDLLGKTIIQNILNDAAIIDKHIGYIKLILIIVVLIVLILSILVSKFYLQRILDRIQKVADSLTHFAKGDLLARVNVESNDEISDMGNSYNKMADSLVDTLSQLDKSKKEIEKYALNLENIVSERTIDLKEKNEELEKAISNLKGTQKRLVAQEKLASLGFLMAGIAHEIQNPLNFVNNFVLLIQDYEKDLEEIINKYQNAYQKNDLAAIKKLLTSIKDDLSTVFQQGSRADKIIKKMLEHSRVKTPEADMCNINDLLKEYIDLAYKGMTTQYPSFDVKIDIELDLSVKFIKITSTDIGRVFLNILNNAFYSLKKKIELKGNTFSPHLLVKTKKNTDFFEIRFRDNGMGIAKESMPMIFTPFFTTKPPGEGTGLGLSLSYDIIVEKHEGSISYETEEGEFAEFIITLPL